MKLKAGIYQNTQINKYGYQFSVEVIESTYSQTWENGTPMFLSHDYHRPYGWSHSTGLYISPLDVTLYGESSFPEKESEKKEIKEKSNQYLTKKNEIDIESKEKLQKLLNEFLSGNEVYMNLECISVFDKNLAKRVLEHKIVIDENDKRSLISIKDLTIIAPGVFEIEGYTVFAHRYFRRSCSHLNNLNDIFLEKLLSLRNNENLDVKIAIDPDIIGLKETCKRAIELEYWWGPKFNDNLLDIPHGVAVYKANKEESFFHGIVSTEFFWYKQDEIQSLEVEELRDLPSFGISDEKFACRYAHSMIDKKNGLPYHLDGAVRIYDEESMLVRSENDISKVGKNTEYIKLWRIDGVIDNVLWKELLNDFFRDNHQVGEYLLGDNLEKNKKEVLNSVEETFFDIKLIEYMSSSDGYHIFISYVKKSLFQNNYEIEVVDKSIEFSAIDLIKLIKSTSPLHTQSDTQYIACEDLDINFPLILHKGERAVSLANQTIGHLYQLCKSYYKNKEDRIISIRIGIEYAQQVVIFSFVSHIESIYKTFSNKPIIFPSFNDIALWCEEQHKLLKEKFNVKDLTNSYFLSKNFFEIKRYSMNEYIAINEEGIYSLKVTKEIEELAKTVENGNLHILPVCLIEKTVCLKCHKDYLECNCISSLDKNCTIEMSKFEPIDFVLSRTRA